MDEFKPEDELKPDPSDRRTGRSRQSSERSERGEPQINFDDIDLDAEDTRPTRAQKERNEAPEVEEDYESEDEAVDEERVERRPRKRKKPAAKPASRQYMMMGVGVLVLLLLIIGIGSALKHLQLHQPVSKQLQARRVLIFLVMQPIRQMGRNLLRERLLLNKPQVMHLRMLLCHLSHLRLLRANFSSN